MKYKYNNYWPIALSEGVTELADKYSIHNHFNKLIEDILDLNLSDNLGVVVTTYKTFVSCKDHGLRRYMYSRDRRKLVTCDSYWGDGYGKDEEFIKEFDALSNLKIYTVFNYEINLRVHLLPDEYTTFIAERGT